RLEVWDRLQKNIESNTKANKLEVLPDSFSKQLSEIGMMFELGMITPIERSNKALNAMNDEIMRLFNNKDWAGVLMMLENLNLEKATNQVITLNNEINKLINDSLLKGFESLSEGIGNLFSGDGFEGLFASLGETLGQQLVELGKLLIKYGVIKMGIDKALESIGAFGGGAGAIIAGVAAVAAGQVMKKSLSKRVRNFASGGVIYDETFARMGEYSNSRMNPEVVAPLDKLRSILGEVGIKNNYNSEPVVLT